MTEIRNDLEFLCPDGVIGRFGVDRNKEQLRYVAPVLPLAGKASHTKMPFTCGRTSTESGTSITLQRASEYFMSERHPRIEAAIFIFPLVFTTLAVCAKVWWPNLYVPAIQEDTILEYAQAVAYIGAGIVAVSVSVAFWRSSLAPNALLYAALACALFFVAAEEISWGQRIFHFATPEYFQKENTHGEFTIHNLDPIQRVLHRIYIIAGLLLAFSWLFMTKGLRHRYPEATRYLIPGRLLSLYFIPVTIVYLYFDYGSRLAVALGCSRCRMGDIVICRDQEPAELLLALGLLIFVTITRLRIARDQTFSDRVTSRQGLVF
jgi:hypothetical protein